VHDEPRRRNAWLSAASTGQRRSAKGKPYPASTKETFRASPGSRDATRRPTASSSTRTARSLGAVRHRGRSDRGRPVRGSFGCAPGGPAGEGCPHFAGKSELDLAPRLDILIASSSEAVAAGGGGGATAPFCVAGLVDELNLILCPAVDGAKEGTSVFDSTDAETDRRAPVSGDDV